MIRIVYEPVYLRSDTTVHVVSALTDIASARLYVSLGRGENVVYAELNLCVALAPCSLVIEASDSPSSTIAKNPRSVSIVSLEN